MSTQTVSFHYTIQNGHFRGTQKTATIELNQPGLKSWEVGLLATTDGTNTLGNGIALFLYAKSLRDARRINADFGARIANLNNRLLPDVTRDLAITENEIATQLSLIHI